MALFRSTAKPSTQNLAYLIPADLQDAMTALDEALDGRARVDAAIAKNTLARQAASETRIAAEAEATRIETELALEIDDAKIIALEGRVESARKSAQDAITVFDRADRLQGAFFARAPDADAQIAAAKQTFQTALSLYSRAASEALAIEAREAVQTLVAVLRRGHAVAATIGTLSRHNGFLGSTVIHSPAPGGQALVENGHAEALDGARTNLAATWRDDPAAVSLADLMGPLNVIQKRVAYHVKFAPPPPPAKPYEVSPANRTAGAHNAAIDAREGPWSPTKGTFTPQVHRFGGSRPGNAAGVEINAVAGIADETTKSSDAA
jgi:tetratricopeptide (TPR) repeat protein